MKFSVVPMGTALSPSKDQAFLIPDDWDDWFKFETTFSLVIFDQAGTAHYPGNVKIGQFGQETRSPQVPESFESLGQEFFSLGQDEHYYETLNALGTDLRDHVLENLRDVAADGALFERARKEDVMTSSLLRFVSEERVCGRLRGLAVGSPELTSFEFSYQLPKHHPDQLAPNLTFEVTPQSHPPTNIHVLIGRNGVGKTTCLRGMTLSLALPGTDPTVEGVFTAKGASVGGRAFANLVSVTFSAFDPFPPLNPRHTKIRYAYVGLQTLPGGARPDSSANAGRAERPHAPKTLDDLVEDFVESVRRCRSGVRATRWVGALKTLEADPLFEAAQVPSLTHEEEEPWEARARRLYRRLSSGHKIVLLTITRLVETVDERTLVILDEPEAHLHPPLLAAFVRCLSELLLQRNGVALIATHSPVVLQEVPKTCAWVLQRTGEQVIAERPEAETFGENVGVLTREVFGLEVTRSGFYKLLEEVIDEKSGDYEAVLEHFGRQLGAEGRAIVRALAAVRNASKLKPNA